VLKLVAIYCWCTIFIENLGIGGLMENGKRFLILLACVLLSLTGVVTAAQRMVVGEMITSTT
jgi:hypothetical protein